MKKVLISIVIVAMMLTLSLSAFAGCTHKLDPLSVEDFEIPEMNIGKEMPDTPDGAVALTADMSAFEMLEAAVNNYYLADYAISQLVGSVDTYISALKVTQVVDAAKIRSGKGDATGNNANGATYFADSISYSLFAKLYEKIVINSDNSIKYRNSDCDYVSRTDTLKIKEWYDIQSDFDGIPDFVEKKANNPTILWMYDLQSEFVEDSSTPIYDEETKTYRFALIFEPVKSTEEYVKTMWQQLEANAGMGVKAVDFKQLGFQVVLWENGMIRSMRITESYNMSLDLKVTTLDSLVTLISNVQYSFAPNEKGYDIATNVASIDSNDKIYTKPYTE